MSKESADLELLAATLVTTAARLRRAAKLLDAATAAEQLLDRVRAIPAAPTATAERVRGSIASRAADGTRPGHPRDAAVFDAVGSRGRMLALNCGGGAVEPPL